MAARTDDVPTVRPNEEAVSVSAAQFPKLAVQESLPFPPRASGSMAGRTMQESVYSPQPASKRLPDDAPNILVILIGCDGCYWGRRLNGWRA